MSIVLVIIGLIVAGITVGKSLVHSAELRSVISDINKYKTAINMYTLQYDALPGDHRNAYDYWPSVGCTDNYVNVVANGCNGNGDGYIAGSEDLRLWQFLALAKMIPGNYTGSAGSGKKIVGTNVPPAEFDGGGYWVHTNYGASAIYGKHGNFIEFGSEASTYLNGAILSSSDAASIDKKMDDGLADDGKVYTANGYDGSVWLGGCVTGAYYAATSNYTLSNEDVLCRMIFWLD